MSLVEDDDVVEQLSPDGADDAFGEGVWYEVLANDESTPRR